MASFVLQGRTAALTLSTLEQAALDAAIRARNIELRIVRDTHVSHRGFVSHLVLLLGPPDAVLVRLVETRIAGSRRFGFESWLLPRASIPLVYTMLRDVPGCAELAREASTIAESDVPCAFPDISITVEADSTTLSFDAPHQETSQILEGVPRSWDAAAAAWRLSVPALRGVVSGLADLGYCPPPQLLALLTPPAPPADSPRKRKGGELDLSPRSPARRRRVDCPTPARACKRRLDSPSAPAKRVCGRDGSE